MRSLARRFLPDDIVDDPHPPKVVLTEFLLFNRLVQFGAPGSPFEIRHTLLLPAREILYRIGSDAEFDDVNAHTLRMAQSMCGSVPAVYR